ncbi:MAG: hypothetical protein M1826_004667 [Phylliscum demangeonii]|nr:MAG: hypothetical protein M1826_004667 [Phylliscum demangeonii]
MAIQERLIPYTRTRPRTHTHTPTRSHPLPSSRRSSSSSSSPCSSHSPSRSPSPETAEDIFSSSAGLLFPDQTRNQHGDPGSRLIYRSPRHGEIALQLAEPDAERERQLFAHYVWNAGLWMAAWIEEEDMRGHRVLELGAGTGLCGIVAVRAGADEVVITDYPAPNLLRTLRRNVARNLPDAIGPATGPATGPIVSVHGHAWGDLHSAVASRHAHSFTRVVASDCLWLVRQHRNLVRSMIHFLRRPGPSPACSAPAPRVWVTAGFHTGRAKVAAFFDVAVRRGLVLERIVERDVLGRERRWRRCGGEEEEEEKEEKREKEEEEEEDVEQRRRWTVVAVLAPGPKLAGGREGGDESGDEDEDESESESVGEGEGKGESGPSSKGP